MLAITMENANGIAAMIEESQKRRGRERPTRHMVVSVAVESTVQQAIPRLLASENRPTFVTINVRDFWEIVLANDKYCVVCLAISGSGIGEIPLLLRRLLRMPEFKTRQSRMGK